MCELAVGRAMHERGSVGRQQSLVDLLARVLAKVDHRPHSSAPHCEALQHTASLHRSQVQARPAVQRTVVQDLRDEVSGESEQ